MKKISYLIIVCLAACTDVAVDPPSFGGTEAETFSTFEGYESYIAKVYASLTLTGQQGADGQADLSVITDEGFSSYLRVWWKAQELTTDEAIIAWQDAGIRDLHNHAWSSDNQFVRVLYYRIFYTISLANDFLRVSESLPADFTADEIAEVNRFRAEARFIRAFSYWHALDHFRNIVLVTAITSDLPQQEEPETIFNFIIDELTEIEDEVFSPGQGSHPYGRVDQGTVWMLKAKMFLNAGVYTGTEQFDNAIIEANKVINSGVYSIHNNYQELFMGDNDIRTNEIIWPIVHDGLVAQTWGGTTTIIRGAIGAAMMDNLTDGDASLPPFTDEAETLFGVPDGWEGYRTTSALVEKFPGAATDPNGESPDSRAIFFTEGQSLDIEIIGDFQDGYAVPKYNNIESTTGERAPGVDQVSTDYPVFRLAEAYLILAEAEIEEDGSIGATTLAYLNELRQRAYGDNSGDVEIGDVTLDWILDERARELYLEATRRTDLIRHGQFTGGEYIWPWKGGVMEGRSTSSHLDIFPIPASDLVANPELEQNDGYGQ